MKECQALKHSLFNLWQDMIEVKEVLIIFGIIFGSIILVEVLK